jgi:hypothetical protein
MSSYDQFHRRRSFSGGFPGNGGLAPPPHSDGGYRYNDPYNSSYQEVSGPPTYPPPNAAQGRYQSDMSFPDSPPSFSSSQPFQSGGSFPSSAGMPSSFQLGTREQPPFATNDSPPTGMLPQPAAYSNSYDSSPLSDNQFANLDDNNYSSRGRTLSTGGGVSFGPSAIIPSAPPMTPYPSHYSAKRMRRASSVGPAMGYAGIVGDPYHRPGGNVTIKFRLKGSNHHGISVAEALDRVRLSQGNTYLMHDIAPDMYGKISLKVRVRFAFLRPRVSLIRRG